MTSHLVFLVPGVVIVGNRTSPGFAENGETEESGCLDQELGSLQPRGRVMVQGETETMCESCQGPCPGPPTATGIQVPCHVPTLSVTR